MRMTRHFFSNAKFQFPKVLPYTTSLPVQFPEPLYVNIFLHDSEHKPKLLTRSSGQAAEFEHGPDGPCL
jgi:hypothetical protein